MALEEQGISNQLSELDAQAHEVRERPRIDDQFLAEVMKQQQEVDRRFRQRYRRFSLAEGHFIVRGPNGEALHGVHYGWSYPVDMPVLPGRFEDWTEHDGDIVRVGDFPRQLTILDKISRKLLKKIISPR